MRSLTKVPFTDKPKPIRLVPGVRGMHTRIGGIGWEEEQEKTWQSSQNQEERLSGDYTKLATRTREQCAAAQARSKALHMPDPGPKNEARLSSFSDGKH